MKKILPGDVSYKTFQDILTGYRLSNTLKVAHESGLFDLIDQQGLPAEDICSKTGWNKETGERFLLALSGLGFLEKTNDNFLLSPFSRQFLIKSSADYQGSSIEFENRLIDSWKLLASALVKGERVFSTEDKTEEDYQKALRLYLKSMDDAAMIRAAEVWDVIKPGENGLILDVGAGSGAFLFEFLNRHAGWKGIFCDLIDVISIAKEKTEVNALAGRLSWVDGNLLGSSPFDQTNCASIVLLSNLVHCQGKEETKNIFSNITGQVSEDGVILVHDFFTDCGWRGALYDIHMMLNTYNGRTYTIDEICKMLSEFSFLHTKKIQLESGPTLLAASRQPFSIDFL